MATASKLVYAKNGDPLSALSLVTEPSPPTLKPNEAHVRVLFSPINPSDVYTVVGAYPHKPELPATPGFEGVIEVISGHKLQPGDRAIVRQFGWGHWRQEGVIAEDNLIKIPKELPLEAAATLIVNPCTAYLMLKKIVPLQAGDSIIQNGANSALGVTVIQFAKAAGIKTINVIRNRPNLEETVNLLKELGADAVITTEDLAKGLDKLNLGLPEPKLALECVGSGAAAGLASALAKGGTLAVYGSLSMEPVHISQRDLIFRGVHVTGFWLTAWAAEHGSEEFGKVVADVIQHYITGKLKLPKFRKFPIAQWQDAIKFATQGFTNEKALLQMH